MHFWQGCSTLMYWHRRLKYSSPWWWSQVHVPKVFDLALRQLSYKVYTLVDGKVQLCAAVLKSQLHWDGG